MIVITHSLIASGNSSTAPFLHLTSLTILGWDGPSLVQLLGTMKLLQLKMLTTFTLHDPTLFSRNRNVHSLSEYHLSVFQQYQPSASVDDLDLVQIFDTLCNFCCCRLHSLSVSLWPPLSHPPN